jgi:hypothetical protein
MYSTVAAVHPFSIEFKDRASHLRTTSGKYGGGAVL